VADLVVVEEVGSTVVVQEAAPPTLVEIAAVGPQGPMGPTGPVGQGIALAGALTDVSQLPASAAPGTSYVVNGNVYVWSN
jgi:hypothetical protein